MNWQTPALRATALLLAPALLSAAEYPPVDGTDRDSEAYYRVAEHYLANLDLEAPGVRFKRLGGTTATNWEVFVDDEPAANLKCSSGNTNHHGAVVAYRLGRALDFNIYPVAVYRDVNRTIDGRRVQTQCALKAWSSIFTQYYWTRDTFDDTDSLQKRKLIKALRCESPQPDAADSFVYEARSAYGNPGIRGMRRVPYSGITTLLQATRDFSNMMVIDTLIGNEDRFPGGNMFFRSVNHAYEQQDGKITYDNVRLYSLDNEAAFKGASPSGTHAAHDLQKHVSRFDAELLAALQRIAADDAELGEIADGDAGRMAFLRSGLQTVVAQYQRSHERCGDDAEFSD